MNSSPFVSVCMITYNHENFIKQAIEGVLMQQTDFEFDLIVANDCSKDRTDLVIQELIASHPKRHVITYFNHQENKGIYANFIFALEQCKGKYVALCEGDDYWTDPFKLQKQVDFLETHPDFEVCFTNMSVIDDAGAITKDRLITDGRRDVYERRHLPIWAPTLTRVFRNRDFSSLSREVPGLDTYMLLWQSQFGNIKFMDFVSGVYRIHRGGVYSKIGILNQKIQQLETELYCFELIPVSLYAKYFGLLFKKLLGVRSYSFKTYRIYLVKTWNLYLLHKNKLNIVLHFKLLFCFVIVVLPFGGKVSVLQRFFNFIFNHLLIYPYRL